MSEKKPNVIPTKDQMASSNAERAKREAFEAEKTQAANEIYMGPTKLPDTPIGHADALVAMQERTAKQLEQSKLYGNVVEPDLAENTTKINMESSRRRSEEQIEIRDAQLQKNIEQTKNYQRLAEEATNRRYKTNSYEENMTNNQTNEQGYIPRPVPSQQPIVQPTPVAPTSNGVNPYLLEISQPNYNSPFDVIPLPSKGKVYKNKKESIRLSYMTTADENILTSPNLLQSGEFLEILINRKILEPSIRYKDLLPGDRNAIMLWLRATAYGEMYPVTLLDEFDEPFDTEINLNELKTIELNETPDEEGLFYFQLPLSKAEIKFKLLTMGDVDDIERIVADEKERNIPINNSNTYRLERMIVEVNGVRDRVMVRDIANSMRISDARAFNEYINSIESGIDLNINVETPGGGSIATFLPLNFNFFWPDFRV